MDPERQPLLNLTTVRSRRYRPLTTEEVIDTRQEVTWRRARFCVVLMFWAIMAMILSMVVFILVRAPNCNTYDPGLGSVPFVPPMHRTFAPLIATVSGINRDIEELKDNKVDDKVFELAW